MMGMNHTGYVILKFNSELNKIQQLQDGLSVIVQIGDALCIANDETISFDLPG
jgi:hypothetical protein